MDDNNSAQKTAGKEEKNIYYIGIYDPKDLQREVLSAAKSVIISLKKYEKIKQSRKEKVELFSDLKTHLKEINILLSKLNHLMPETKIRHLHFKHGQRSARKKEPLPKHPQQPKVEQVEPVVQKTSPKVISDLDKLERELEMIEHKLEYATKNR